MSITPVKRSSRTGSVPGNTLAGIAIFRELPPDVIAMLSQRCRWRRYGPGQTILQHRDEGRDVYFVVSGRVCAVYYSPSGREVHFNDLQAGEVFGELATIDGKSRATDIVSATDALIASMSADLFWDVLRRHEESDRHAIDDESVRRWQGPEGHGRNGPVGHDVDHVDGIAEA